MSKNHVIASQCAHWRGNPPDFRTFSFQNLHILLLFRGSPHQSADWFAMTVFLGLFLQSEASPAWGSLLFSVGDDNCFTWCPFPFFAYWTDISPSLIRPFGAPSPRGKAFLASLFEGGGPEGRRECGWLVLHCTSILRHSPCHGLCRDSPLNEGDKASHPPASYGCGNKKSHPDKVRVR